MRCLPSRHTVLALAVVSGLSVMSISQPSAAASFASVTLQETLRGAPIVVHGVAVPNTTIAPQHPFLYFDLKVTKVLKGTLPGQPDVITIRELNGHGPAGHPREGKPVVLMLNGRNDQGSYDLYGMEMGELEVDPSGELHGPAIAMDNQIAEEAHAKKGLKKGHVHKKWTLPDIEVLSQKN